MLQAGKARRGLPENCIGARVGPPLTPTFFLSTGTDHLGRSSFKGRAVGEYSMVHLAR